MQIATQSRLTDEQAEKLVRTVLYAAEETIGDSVWDEIKDTLLDDWKTFVSKV